MTFDDLHAHTNLSYCCESTLTPHDYVRAIRRNDVLRRVAITNHGFAIYFPEPIAWRWRFMTEPVMFDDQRVWGNERLRRHLDEVDALRDEGLMTGVEVEMMSDGRLTIDPKLIDRLDVIVGSVHWLPPTWQHGGSSDDVLREWLAHTRQLIRAGIDVLGHPLRWIDSQFPEIPDEVVCQVVEACREAGVAVEINSHQIIHADVSMLQEVARTGALVTFCTDAHERDEIGEFGYHRRLLDRAGLTADDLTLWTPTRRP